MSVLRPLCWVVLLPLLAACAQSRPPAGAAQACAAGASPATEYQLFFGRAKPGGLVSEAEWQGFVDGVLTPAFPDGLTVLDAEGRWLDPDLGRSIAEPSKVVVVFAFDPADAAKVAAVTARYKSDFQQQAVLVTARPGCFALH